jgi:hypothetical protein
MSQASDLFWKAHGNRFLMPGDKNAYELLNRAASLWREQGNFLSAGIAMSDAIDAAWGEGDPVYSCARSALDDFRRCYEESAHCSHEALLAIHNYCYGRQNHYLERTAKNGLLDELGDRLLRCFVDSPNRDGYLVKGFILRGNLDDPWEAVFPEYEVIPGGEFRGEGFANVNLSSAFRIFVSIADYQGAGTIINRCPDSFTTPGLRGWRAAVRGFTEPSESPERFEEAANEFSKDIAPDWPAPGQVWNSQNVELWAKFFRAKAALARIIRDPSRALEFLRMADSALPEVESGWLKGTVLRLGILIRTLVQLTGAGQGLTINEARERFLKVAQLTGEEISDEVILRFLNLAGDSFAGFREDPAKEIVTGNLATALETLGRVPVIGPEITGAVSRSIGSQAYSIAPGADRTWVHRTLESTGSEKVLQKIILRLIQASPSPPAYGQITHGPLEYGKDVIVLLEENGRSVLRMYQVKCGDIDTSKWRQARNELEEMFLVDVSPLQIRGPIDQREGILICNGHAIPHVQPTMTGWFEEQRRDHRRQFRFMHLDDIVSWIFGQRLINTFRNVCADLGLSTQ